MEHDEYRKMYRLEERHWWFVAKRRLLLKIATPYLSKKTRVLDVGCGTGIIMDAFRKQAKSVTGLDFSDEALKFCRKRGLRDVHKVDLEKPLPKTLGKYDLIIATDIIEHLHDHTGALKRLKSLLAPGGVIIVSVPAYQWMWSEHDIALHHKRRYTASRLQHTMRAAGYDIRKLTYTNVFIFFPAATIRLAKRLIRPFTKRARKSQTDVGMASAGFASKLLLGLYAIESVPIQRARMPFGVSVLCVAAPKKVRR